MQHDSTQRTSLTIRHQSRPPQGGTAPDGAFWTQFSFPSKKLTVVAVRGTEFWRLSDYLEDIRMYVRDPFPFSRSSVSRHIAATELLSIS
eukprot:953031-Rhodomonas_salina.1